MKEEEGGQKEGGHKKEKVKDELCMREERKNRWKDEEGRKKVKVREVRMK